MPASTSSLPRLASPRWPGNAQCVVLVTVNFDAESVDLTETREENLYGRYSYGRYGMRAGLARLLDAFANTGTKATVFVPATDAQRHPAALDTHRRHDEAFLKQLGGAKRHATGTHPAHVGMMRPHRGVPNDALGIVRVGDHLDHREVGQMRAPVRRFVEQEHVTRRGATGTDRRDRFWHGTKVYRNVRRLRHHATIGIE